MNGQLGVRILLSYLRRIGSEQTWLNLEIEPETIWQLVEVQPIESTNHSSSVSMQSNSKN
jgi:hypothetical protein